MDTDKFSFALQSIAEIARTSGICREDEGLAVISKEVDSRIPVYYIILAITGNREFAPLFVKYGNTLLLDIASVDNVYTWRDALSKITSILLGHHKFLGVTRFGVYSVSGPAPHAWCSRRSMHRLDEDERWRVIPNVPIDYLIDWT